MPCIIYLPGRGRAIVSFCDSERSSRGVDLKRTISSILSGGTPIVIVLFETLPPNAALPPSALALAPIVTGALTFVSRPDAIPVPFCSTIVVAGGGGGFE